MRLDIDLELVPDLPPQLMSLLRLQPASGRRACARWTPGCSP